MTQLIDDLLIFTCTRLGDTLPVSFTPQDIGRICNDAADEVRASYPDACIDLGLSGEIGSGLRHIEAAQARREDRRARQNILT